MKRSRGPPYDCGPYTPAVPGPQGRRNLEQGIWPGFSCELGLGLALSRLQHSLFLTFKNMNNNINNKDEYSVCTGVLPEVVQVTHTIPSHLHSDPVRVKTLLFSH